MKIHATPIAATLATLLCACAVDTQAQTAPSEDVRAVGTVTIVSPRPTSLPTQIPTTIEGVDSKQIADQINATDSEDALKYLPSLLVRKRYIGDYNHAVLSTRASGTGNSARSMVYADGILLSNYLGNGAGYAPRWGLVTPEEIERVDVLYGPFSAAYAGNSVGAVVDYVTRMPERFEAHLKLGLQSQRFDLYNTSERDNGRQMSAALGDRNGAFAWWIDVSRLNSSGQPLVMATRNLSDGVTPTNGVAVSGAVLGQNNKNQDWWILGTTSSYQTTQEQAKIKLSYDLSPTLRASYILGWWNNSTDADVNTYLRDAAGNPVYSGNVIINGLQYNLDSSSLAFAPTKNRIEHLMQGTSVKSNTRGDFDWEVAASRYDYQTDSLRTPTSSASNTVDGGAGRITDMQGSGWNTLNLRGIWRTGSAPNTPGSHVVEFGAQRDSYKLRTLVSDTDNWISGAAGNRYSAFNGNTQLLSLYAQDTWRFAPDWKTTLGLRAEHWRAYGGELGNSTRMVAFGSERSVNAGSPKAALAWQYDDDWVFKSSLGRAVRMPTASELYQGSISGNTIIYTDPNLLPETSWTSELTAERRLDGGVLRATAFFERTRDALYSQALTATVNTVQNIDAIRTHGLELAWQQAELALKGLELEASATYTDSIITANSKLPASVGKRQPRVPVWRASAVATYRPDAAWAWTLAGRYSGVQYGQLDNSDSNGMSYLGFSRFLVFDTRVRYRWDRQWSSAFGIDNLGNAKYWAYHPYAQRTLVAELKWDL